MMDLFENVKIINWDKAAKELSDSIVGQFAKNPKNKNRLYFIQRLIDLLYLQMDEKDYLKIADIN